ncbi:MAG: hypothetical protein KDE27_23515, partial [Planctomycetes bacterium]|nr:hypothetical protein [Planctomycetota bacterium]
MAWTEVRTAFEHAVECDEAERARFLAELAPELRTRVAQLLAADAAAIEPPSFVAGSPAIPERLGPFRLIGIVGEGGMGTVFAAEQTEPIVRRVALMVVRAGMDT